MMIATWTAARDRALEAASKGVDEAAAAGFRAMAAVEALACNGGGKLTERLALALLAAEADAAGDDLSPAWDIVRSVLRDLAG